MAETTLPYETDTPEVYAAQGWHRVKHAEVYRKGDRLVVVGIPAGDDAMPDDDPRAHNCDVMGCPSAGGHNVIIGRVERPTESQQRVAGKVEAALREEALRQDR